MDYSEIITESKMMAATGSEENFLLKRSQE